jgi:undecaprenyl-diphosphatase
MPGATTTRANGNQQRQHKRARRRFYTVVVVLAFSTFGVLLGVVRRNPRLAADVSTTLRVQRRRRPFLTQAMRLISWLGFRPQSLVLPGASVGLAWVLGNGRDARYLFVAWGASFASYTTKRLVMRPRPNGLDIQVVEAGLRDSSFPSGHVLHYVVFWGFVCYLWDWHVRHTWLRRIPVTILATIIGLVGISRIYLGHHWLTDVLGSYSLGTGILLSLIGLRTRGTKDRI